MEVNDWKNYPRLSDAEWSAITMPMLLIAGEQDAYATRERLERIQRHCPQAKIYIAKGCGHGAHMPTQDATGVNNVMLDFLKQYTGK